MIKFKFVKQADQKGFDNLPKLEEAEPVLDIAQILANEEQKTGFQESRRNKRIEKRRKKEMNAPYGVYNGDRDSLTSGDPSSLGRIAFYHRSEPHLRNKRTVDGRLKVHELKDRLTRSSDYDIVPIPVEQYAYNERWAKLAPRSLNVFVKKPKPSSFINKRAISSEMRQARRFNNLEKVTKQLRGETGSQANVDELNPDHPLNIFEESGPEEMLMSIFTDRNRKSPDLSLSDEAKAKICVCGHGEEDHEKDGSHKFIPKYVMNSNGLLVPGNEFRSSRSRLRYSVSTTNRSDNPSSPSTKYEFQLADRGLGIGSAMPIVTVGLAGSRVERTYLRPNGLDQFGKPMSPVTATPTEDIYGSYEKCKGTKDAPCYGGNLSPKRFMNATFCEDCLPGNPIYSSDGSRQIGEGLGNGRFKILNEMDAPKCPHCNGEGGKFQLNKSGSLWIPCSACGESGLDKTAMGHNGTNCLNCNSSDSTISLTDAPSCPICNGTGRTPVRIKKKPKEGQIEQRDLVVTTNEGNPITLEKFDDSGFDGIDGYKSEGDKTCTECAGDNTYKNSEGKPCSNCMIGSFDDPENIIAPKGARFVFPTEIKVPEYIYQKAMRTAYPDSSKNPHRRSTDFGLFDPETQLPNSGVTSSGNPIVSYKLDGKDIDTKRFVGVSQPGISFTPEDINYLNDRSKAHRSHPNAEFIAGSAELKDIHDLLVNRFSSLPINIPGLQVDAPQARVTENGIDTSALHPKVQDAAKKMHDSILGLDISPASLRTSIKPMLEKASLIENARDSGGNTEDLFGDYENSLNGVISDTIKRHGDDQGKRMREMLTRDVGLPSPTMGTAEPKVESDAK